jgi:hypothetical protein
MNENVRRLVRIAKEWDGKYFNYGQREQCAAFVRHVFHQAGFDLPNVPRPSDAYLLPKNAGLGPDFADSFAGNEVGIKVSPYDLLPGDIVMFPNTYKQEDGTPFPLGVITHVGIYVGDGMMVDRPTMNAPVIKRSVWKFGKIAEVRRPRCLYPSGTPAYHRAKMFFHDGAMSAYQSGNKTDFMDVEITMKPALRVVVNHAVVMPKAILFETEDIAGKRAKLYFHDGVAKAFENGKQVQNLRIKAQMAGRVQCWVNGNELNPRDLKLEVVS